MSSVQPERIRQCLSDVLTGSEEARERALRVLTSLTKVNPRNRTLLAQSEQAVPTFLALSKSPSVLIRTLSLAVLFNLSLNSDLKRSLADPNTISCLNSIIADPVTPPELARLAASLVCSLAMLDKNKAGFGVAGTVQLLVARVADSASSRHLMSSLAELVHFHGNSTLAVRAGAVPVLLCARNSTEEGGDGLALAVLSQLARFDQGLRALRETERVVEKMADVLRGRCMFSKEGAAEILVRLFDESEGCIRDALRLPDFPTLVADLSIRGSAKAREMASVLMKKVVEADLDVYVEESPFFIPVGVEF